MAFDTAIFYDIENLIGGYGKAEMLQNLSLKKIHKRFESLEIGGISVQRAYANWSTPSLNILKNDIVELGINPIQMVGFGQGPDKNASDIHLVIDAIDIACHRPFINNFIIVSGDGGFAPLAQRLHEYGKRVIGCSYERTANKVLESVCDEFFVLEEPARTTLYSNAKTPIKKQTFTDSVLVNYARSHPPLDSPSRDKIIDEAVNIVEFIANHQESAIKLGSQGLSISILIQAIKHRLGVIDYPSIGFLKQIDFVNYITTDSSCRLVIKPPSDHRLVFNRTQLASYEDLKPVAALTEINVSPHSTGNYKYILAKGEAPYIKLPELIVLYDIVDCMISHPERFENVLYKSMSQYLEYALDYADQDIKSGLSCLLATVAMTQDDASLPFESRRFTFSADDVETAIEYLENTMHEKLMRTLGNVDKAVFSKLLSLDLPINSTIEQE